MGLMGLIELARLAGPTLARMALDGELRWRHVWTALEGSEKYLEAVEAGDLADEAVAQARAGCCAACPASTRDARFIRDEEVIVGWCGPRLEPRAAKRQSSNAANEEAPLDDGPTCGCMVFQQVRLTVGWTGGVDPTIPLEERAERTHGRVTAAGKTMVGSERCPRGRW